MKLQSIPRKFLLTLCSAALVLIGTTTVAATSDGADKNSVFDITSRLLIDGKLVSSPRIVTPAGTSASVNIASEDRKETLDISLIACDASYSDIKIKYSIQYKGAIGRISSKQEIVVTPNHEETLSLGSNKGHTYEMRVLAKRE